MKFLVKDFEFGPEMAHMKFENMWIDLTFDRPARLRKLEKVKSLYDRLQLEKNTAAAIGVFRKPKRL